MKRRIIFSASDKNRRDVIDRWIEDLEEIFREGFRNFEYSHSRCDENENINASVSAPFSSLNNSAEKRKVKEKLRLEEFFDEESESSRLVRLRGVLKITRARYKTCINIKLGSLFPEINRLNAIHRKEETTVSCSKHLLFAPTLEHSPLEGTVAAAALKGVLKIAPSIERKGA